MNKILFLILFCVSCVYTNAQTSITYSDLKKMVDGSQSEAVRLFKEKGLTYRISNEKGVIYADQNYNYSLIKGNYGFVKYTLYGEKYEYKSNEILKTILKLGYKEINSGNKDGLGFCTTYSSTNYYIRFCDDRIKYNDLSSQPLYEVHMESKF